MVHRDEEEGTDRRVSKENWVPERRRVERPTGGKRGNEQSVRGWG